MKLPILNLLTAKRLTGNLGEHAAAKFLRRRGYRIRERNYVAYGHEIDLICEKKNMLVFVEVKTRTIGKESPKEPRPASAVTPEKQRKIFSAANYYVKIKNLKMRMRFDIIEVYLSSRENQKPKVQRIEHLEGAFNRGTASCFAYR